MKIQYLAFIRLPTEKAHGIQIMKTCEAFADLGVEVELVLPGRKTTLKADPYQYYGVKRNFTITSLTGLDVVWMGTIGYILSALQFSELAKLRTVFWRADYIYSRDAFVLLQYVFLGRRLVYEAHTKPTLISTLVARLAHKVVVISEGLRDAYVKKGVAPSKIVVAHDASSLDFTRALSQPEARARLGLPQGVPVAMYVGRIDASKGVPVLAAAAAHTSASVVIIGEGPLKQELQQQYPSVTFLLATPYEDLPNILPAADVLVIPNSARDVDTALYTSPMKLFSYLASGVPVVASDVPAIRIVAGAGATYAAPDDPSALGAAIEKGLRVERAVPRPVFTWTERAQTICTHLT